MSDNANINGVGLCCSLGKTFAQSVAAYAAGEMNFEKPDDVIGPDGMGLRLASVFAFHDIHNIELRFQRLFQCAFDDLIEQTGHWPEPLVLRLLIPGWLEDNPICADLKTWIIDNFSERFSSISVGGGGNAMFLEDIAKGVKMVSHGQEPAVIVGAVDSFLYAPLIDALALRKQLFNKQQPHGLTPSEAAVLVRICTPEVAVRGIPSGTVAAVWSGNETKSVENPDGLIGIGLAQPFVAACEARAPDRLLIDLNGERWRSEEISHVLARAQNVSDDLAADFETPAMATGFCGCATGGVLTALALAQPSPNWSLQERDEEWSLISTSQYDGQRAVALIRRDVPEAEE